MKIEIQKETQIGGTIFFNLYIDGAYHKCFGTLEDAMERIDLIKKNKESKKEIIHTEEI